MRNKVVEILDIAIKQTTFLKDLSEEFTKNLNLAEYIIIVSLKELKVALVMSSADNGTSGDNYVAKYMMT